MNWYYKLLATRPYLVLIFVAVFSLACIVVSLTFQKLPDFTDPTLGFESRGTYIGKRLCAWQNLLKETRQSGMLVANPNDILAMDSVPQTSKKGNQLKHKHRKAKLKAKLKQIKDSMRNTTRLEFADAEHDYHEVIDTNSSNSEGGTRPEQHWNYGKNLSSTNEDEFNEKLEQKKNQWKLLREQNPPSATTDIHIKTDGFFCDAPNPEYAHFVVQRIDHNLNDSLFDLNGMLALCELETQLTETKYYDVLCENQIGSTSCCRPWSLPNYVALLANRSSCSDIENEDIDLVRNLLQECFVYYQNLKLSNDCEKTWCRVPPECEQHNAVYNILHYLVDVAFITGNESNMFLTTAMIFTPIARSTKALPLYYNLEKKLLANKYVAIVAMDMGLKNALFDDCLLLDGWLIGLGGLFVMICMWLYTKSFIIMIMTFIAIIFSLGIAYFVYALLFELPFFPFMNVLAVVVIVGIGADDAFIFVKIWNCAISERTKSIGSIGGGGCPLTSTSSMTSDASNRDTLAGLIDVTLTHAAISMGVTSLTTAVAFYTSFINSITAIKCFGIFAGTAVISNYVLMITWLPASVSFVERLSCWSPVFWKHTTNSLFSSINQVGTCMENCIVSAVVNMPKLWIVLLGTVGLLSGVILFYWPKLQLPDSPDFKLFDSDHPFEAYESRYRNLFWFEKLYTDSETFKMPIRFVWGVKPIDNGNYMDPSARGDLHLDENFNISSKASQLWLLDFCKDFKKQPFYQTTIGPAMLPNCFIENFIRTMDRRCLDTMSGIDRTPCCETSTFPYPPHIFDECLPQIISMLYESPRYVFIPGIAGPKFGHHTKIAAPSQEQHLPDNASEIFEAVTAASASRRFPVVKALVVEYDSSQQYTMAYAELESFQLAVQQWLDAQLLNAPAGMKNAWFTSDLAFFDLQSTLSQDTIYAIVIAMTVSLGVLLMVTLNLLISLYAIVTVTFTIFTTIAILVLMNWKLNVLESISVSTAIGLTIDFSLHYGNYYRMCPEMEREQATRYALARMIGPTAMAAITTGAAGAFMMPSRVLAYIQIGKFLVIVMAVSWIFSTFFLMSLLRLCGPQYGFGQFRMPQWRKQEKKNGEISSGNGGDMMCNKSHADFNKRLGQGTATEQLLSASSSAAGDMVPSESHELSSLTSNSIVKPLTAMDTRPINFDRAFKTRFATYPKDNSPTSASAITEMLPDDCELDNLEY